VRYHCCRRPDDRAWVERWGYGLVNQPEFQQPLQPNSNPNAKIINAMTRTEQDAYWPALNGDAEGADANHDGIITEEEIWENEGCGGWAQGQIAASSLTQQSQFKPIIDALNAFYASFDADNAEAVAQCRHDFPSVPAV
jgi:hypothetical protein